MWAATSRVRREGSGRSMVARNASAVSGPTPGTPISRRQTGSARTAASTRRGSWANSCALGGGSAGGGDAREQRLARGGERGVVPDQLADPRGELLAGGPAELEAGLAQQRPQAVLEVAHLVQHQPACRQQGAPGPTGRALHVHRPVPAGADDLREPARVVAAGVDGPRASMCLVLLCHTGMLTL